MAVTRYVCRTCGYVEQWVDPEELERSGAAAYWANRAQEEMRAELERNALLRQRRKARKAPIVLSLDAWQADGSTLYDVLPDKRCADPADIVIHQERAAQRLQRAVRSCKVYRFPACAALGKEAA